MTTEKVVPLFNQNSKSDNNKKSFDTEVYDQIMRFLRNKKRRSKNTSEAYERDIRQFFLQTRGKHIEHLTKEDLNFTSDDIEDYQAHLLDELKVNKNTSNRHLTSISSCIRYLYGKELVKDLRCLEISRQKATPDSWDGLTSEEIKKSAEFVLTQGRKFTAKNKHALILFAYDTCMRLQECLELKWSDIGELDKKDNMFPVRTIAKGNKIMHRKISVDIYNMLLKIKKEDSDKVFHISESTVERMMEQIRQFLNIDPNKRNIVFHSIRKAGAQWIWENTRDINQVSKALGHASIQTTELYINKNESYSVGAISSTQGIDRKLYKKVSYRELIKAIDSLGVDKQMFINMKLQELKNH